MRKDEGNKMKQTMKMELRGTQTKEIPTVGRMYNIMNDTNKYGLEEGVAQDRIL